MGPLQYILGAILLVAAIFLVVVVVLQNKAKRGLSGAIGGTSSDSFFGKNQGQTKEKKLARFTTVSAIVFAVLTVAAYIFLS